MTTVVRYYAFVAGATHKHPSIMDTASYATVGKNYSMGAESLGNYTTAAEVDGSGADPKTSLGFAIALSLVISMAMQGLFNLRYVH
jgi:hypothetical protein